LTIINECLYRIGNY